jgi:hypothetical protein
LDHVRINYFLTMKLELSVELINKVLAYLGKRPYEEVFQLIAEIHTEAKPKEISSVAAEVLKD